MASSDLVKNVPQVSPVSGRVVQISEKAMGSEIFAAQRELSTETRRFAGVLSDIGIDRRDRAEQTEAQDLMNNLNRRRRELLSGEAADPLQQRAAAALGEPAPTGYYSLKKGHATGRRQEFEDLINQSVDDALSAASSDRVRALMGKAAENVRNGAINKISDHSRQEQEAHELEVYETTLKEALQNAVTNSVNQEDVLEAIGDIDKLVRAELKRQGSDPAAIKSIAEDKTTAAYVAVFKDLLRRGETAKAKALYEKVTQSAKLADGLNSTVAGEMLKIITKDAIRGEARDIVKDIEGLHKLDTAAGAKSALQSIREKYKNNNDLLDVLEPALTARIAEATALSKRADRERFDALSTRAGGGEIIKESDRIGLSAREKKYLDLTTKEARLKKVDPDYLRPGDGGKTWEKFIRDSRNVKNFSEQTLSELKTNYEAGVTQKIWDTIILPQWQQSGLKVSGAEAKDKGAAGQTPLQRTKASALQAGVDIKDQEEFAIFHSEYDRRVRAADARTADEQQKILDGMVKEKIVFDKSDLLFGTDDTELAFQMTASQKMTMAVDAEIDQPDRAAFVENFDKILDQLRTAKKAITRKNILSVWASRKPAQKP